MTNIVKNTLITGATGLVIGAFGKSFSDISDNTHLSKLHHQEIREIKDAIKELQREQKSLPDIYVTRREFQIVIENLNSTLEKNNAMLEKLADKL